MTHQCQRQHPLLHGPHVTVTYTCSLGDAATSFTTTHNATATTQAGPKITATATATAAVTVETPPLPPSPSSEHSNNAKSAATLDATVSKTIVLDKTKRKLILTIKTNKPTSLVLTLLDYRHHKLIEWIEREKAGTHTLELLVPLSARHKGNDTLHITEPGNTDATTLPVTLAG